ncbi:MAG: Cell wall endopeptidase, family M23/M37 [Proteiniphilum acetatigenes]|uniref:Cell wall endopeptidase, family M23/M37 n=1 Tax=Proteiniphilum acetatigenes TaxID=294710 RepID=A0A101HJX2_9BACT|nr:MAG: Cell wall endopeptidase, family M23/M37 [Proteiniphilum acetatigenes]
MGLQIQSIVKLHLNGIIHSYAQIFFSQNRTYGMLLLLLSMLDIRLGAGGLAAVVLTNLLAHLLGFSKTKIESGLYGFNAIFIGISMMYKFHFNLSFAILFIFAVILGFMLTIWFETLFAKHQIPILTLPFVFTLALVDLSFGTFTRIMPILPFERFTVLLAEQMQIPWYNSIHSLDHLQLPQMLYFYLKTMASIFFTDSILVGAILVIALLFHSRIKSTVAFLGFFFAFETSKLMGVDIRELTQDLAGVNYIFWGMAIGSFFIIPNSYSYLLVIGLTPVLFLFYTGIENLIADIGISSYTLSFSLLSILLLYILKQRSNNRFFIFPFIQYYDPEKTVYKNVNYMQRFGQGLLFKFQLPFLDRWTVSQGYDGGITHLGEWGKALDFVITDEEGKSCFGQCAQKEEFYCYNKPVLAPADGYIYMISNITDENAIDNVNTEKNWGNSIVINHLNGLYTQMNHLKKDSFRVRIGDYVKKGTVVASCGNSGRSPVPHLHFQVQLSPEIGAMTHPYPFGYFFEEQHDAKPLLRIGEIPKEGSIVYNVPLSSLASEALQAKPGRVLRVKQEDETWLWRIATDAYNKTYIRCDKTGSTAYFENDGTMFYFTDFEGKKSSPLYLFYRSCFKLLLSNEKGITIKDWIPLTKEHPAGTKWLQDFFAPFILFTRIGYESVLTEADNVHYPEKISYRIATKTSFLRLIEQRKEASVTITRKKIEINAQKRKLCIDWE